LVTFVPDASRLILDQVWRRAGAELQAARTRSPSTRAGPEVSASFCPRRRADRRTVRAIVTARPVIIGFDGTPASERAVREAAALLAPRPAVVVVVWEAGRAYEAATTPALEAPSVALDIKTAFDADQGLFDEAQRVAQRGAALAQEAGLVATGLAVADVASVADTLIRLAREHRAQAIAIGAHGHRGITKLVLGSTSRDVLQHAPCPVVVVRHED